MPVALLNSHVEQLPKITAEESLLDAARVAVGSGSLKKGKAGQIQRDWQRQAAQHTHVIRPKSKEMYAAQMAGLGIGVKRVKRA